MSAAVEAASGVSVVFMHPVCGEAPRTTIGYPATNDGPIGYLSISRTAEVRADNPP